VHLAGVAQSIHVSAAMGSRRKLKSTGAAMEAATSFSEWREAAAEHDACSGAEAWRAEDTSTHYDASSLRESIAQLSSAREADDGLRLAGLLTEDLYRHLNDLASPDLYERAFCGTKHLVERYLTESETSLRWLAEWEAPELARSEKLRRFELAHKVFGRSALLLSGGATWGFHHLGVVKALLEQGLLPHIISGSSTGAMIAAGVCARNEEELHELFAKPEDMRLDGLVPMGAKRSLSAGAWLDPEKLYEVLLHNCGDWTFAEAFARSGRTLNISVSPTRHRQKPRLLTHLTAPDVLIARAAVASSAMPGLFPPVVLHKRGQSGEVVEYIPSERWVDGSLHGDLPKQRLSRLHNVNHFIVSQTNPVLLPFVQHGRKRGMRATVAGLLGATVRGQGGYAADLARRATPSGPVSQIANQAYAFVNQEFSGDIDIHPRLTWESYKKVVSNPTYEDLERFIVEGERAVWPQVSKFQNQTRIGRAFRECVSALGGGARAVVSSGSM
jgi:TAG lipase/steryl ester hydrolase/phospholipase A2/LPA acyltransferase